MQIKFIYFNQRGKTPDNDNQSYIGSIKDICTMKDQDSSSLRTLVSHLVQTTWNNS